RAGVREVFALEEDAGAAERRAQPFRLVERRGAPDIVPEQILKLSREGVVSACREIRTLELLHRRHERFGDEPAAIGAVVAARVGIALSEGRANRFHYASPDLPAPRRTRASCFRP